MRLDGNYDDLEFTTPEPVEVTLGPDGGVPDLTTGETRPAYEVMPEVPSYTSRTPQGSDQVPFLNQGKIGGLTKFAVDLIQGAAGVPAGMFDSYLQTKAKAMGVPDADFPELKRIVASLQYEDYSTDNPLGIPVGTGDYVGENVGTAAGFGASVTSPFVALQKAAGKKLSKNQQKYEDFLDGKFTKKGDIEITETAPGIYQTSQRPLIAGTRTGKNLRDRAVTSMAEPFAANASRASKLEYALAGIAGGLGMANANRVYDDALAKGLTEEEAEDKRFWAQLIGELAVVPAAIAGSMVNIPNRMPIIDRIMSGGKNAYTRVKDEFNFLYGSGKDVSVMELADQGSLTATASVQEVAESLREQFADIDQISIALQQARPAQEKLGTSTPFRLDELFAGEGQLADPFIQTLARQIDQSAPEVANQRLKEILKSLAVVTRGMVGDPTTLNHIAIYDMANDMYLPISTRLDNAGDELTFMHKKLLESLSENPVTDVGTQLLLNRKQAGKILQSDLTDTVTAWNSAMKAKADAMGINSSAVLLDANAVDQGKQRLKDLVFAGQDPVAGAKAQAGLGPIDTFLKWDANKVPFTFMEWKTLREQMNSAYGAALAKGDNRAKDFKLALDELDNIARLEQDGGLVGPSAFGEQTTLFRQWADEYELGKNLTDGILYKASAKATSSITLPDGKQVSLYKTAPEKLADMFLQDSQTAVQFMYRLGQDPFNQNAMRNVIIDKLQAAILKPDGSLDEVAYKTFMNKNRDILDELPFMEGELDSIGRVAENISARNIEQAALNQYVGQNSYLTYVREAAKTDKPTQFLANMWNDPNAIKSMKEAVFARAKEDGVLKQVEEAWNADFMTSFLRDKGLDAGSLRSLLTENPSKDDMIKLASGFKETLKNQANFKVLSAAFGDNSQHLSDMFVLSDIMERTLKFGMYERTTDLDKNLIQSFLNSYGLTQSALSNRILSVNEGRLGARQALTYFGFRALGARKSAQTLKLWQEALNDPDLARVLASQVGGPNSKGKPAPMDIAEIPEMKVGLNAMNYMFVSGKGAVLGEEVEVDETGEQRTVTSTPTMVDLPEDAVGFAEGGEVVTPEKPVEKHKMSPPIRFNPQVQMVPVASPTDQQQPPQQPQNPQQAPNKMDYSQAFPFDTTGGMIAEKNKPQQQPPPRQPPPRQPPPPQPPRQPPPRQNPMQQGIGALR